MKRPAKRINPKWLMIVIPFLMGATLVDPTRPPDFIFSPKTYTASQPLQLTATFIYPTYRLAIINDQIVKVGDQIDAFTVTTINPFTIELKGAQNNVQVLQLVPPVRQERH